MSRNFTIWSFSSKQDFVITILRAKNFANRVKRKSMEFIFMKVHWWCILSLLIIHVYLYTLHTDMMDWQKILDSEKFRNCVLLCSQTNLCASHLSMLQDISISGWYIKQSGFLYDYSYRLGILSSCSPEPSFFFNNLDCVHLVTTNYILS